MKRKKEKKDGEEADDRDTFGISEKLKRKELSDGREREREREREGWRGAREASYLIILTVDAVHGYTKL
jgi:hypothetical protein